MASERAGPAGEPGRFASNRRAVPAGAGAWQRVRIIAREAGQDDILGESAKAAYYFFLSLFPAILALFAFTGILGGRAAFEEIMAFLRQAMPGEAATYLEGFVQEITGRQRPGMLSLGLLLTVWSASNIFGALATSLNVVYDIEEARSWWKRKAVSIVAMVVSLALFAVGAAAILAGPSIVRGLGLPTVWNTLRWPIAFVLITAMIWLMYYLLPNHGRSPSKLWTLVGAIAGAALWTAATFGFQFYISRFGSYSKTYGVVGGIMILLLWLYLSALAVLVGAEIAATMEQGTEPLAAGQEKVRSAARTAPPDSRRTGHEPRTAADRG